MIFFNYYNFNIKYRTIELYKTKHFSNLNIFIFNYSSNLFVSFIQFC